MMQPKDTPSLGDLPSELLLEINEHLSEAGRNALARTNREIYGWINHILYCDNIRHSNASALRWAVINNMESTVHMCLERGATIDPPPLSAKEEEIHRINCRHQFHPRTTQPHDLPLISIAAEKGYDRMARTSWIRARIRMFLSQGLAHRFRWLLRRNILLPLNSCSAITRSTPIQESHTQIYRPCIRPWMQVL
ncbi:hypothetical protein BJX62DRAFT_100668 [Aspergillus germanicus]